MADNRLGRDAKAIVDACTERNLISIAPSKNLTDTFSGQTTEQRTGKLIQSILSSVEFEFISIDYDLPSYNSLIGDHTDIEESVPTTTTGGSDEGVVSGVKKKKDNTEADCLWPFSKKRHVDDNDDLFYYYHMEAKSGRGIALIINNKYWNDLDGKHTGSKEVIVTRG